ncbi:MAG: cellulase family glycosylhydrolase [bacterium]
MLKTLNRRILDRFGREIKLKGFNLGGWLSMEGYILGGRNISEREFLYTLSSKWPGKRVEELIRHFRSTFIKKDDLKNIQAFGFNCIRLPLHYKLFTTGKLNYGISYIKYFANLCKKNRIYCILDLHSAPGSQNADWHSDSLGKSFLWSNKRFQNQVISIWESLADCFKHEETIAGYNLLNEPVTDKNNMLKNLYRALFKSIRSIDKKHIIFLDGNIWSQDFSFLDSSLIDNTVLSPHFYLPISYVMNFMPDFHYPGLIEKKYWDKNVLRMILKKYYDLGTRFNVPVMIGEFGINLTPSLSRGEAKWLDDVLSIFDKFDFHWTYWSYKSIQNSYLPSGLFYYSENPRWVNREGPNFGWENYVNLNPAELNNLYSSWDTKNFKLNKDLLLLLKKHINS